MTISSARPHRWVAMDRIGMDVSGKEWEYMDGCERTEMDVRRQGWVREDRDGCERTWMGVRVRGWV